MLTDLNEEWTWQTHFPLSSHLSVGGGSILMNLPSCVFPLTPLIPFVGNMLTELLLISYAHEE